MASRRHLLRACALGAPFGLAGRPGPGRAQAMPPPPDALRRGLNITNWFRFPASDEPTRLRAYMPDAAMAAIRGADFTFVRLCIQPQVLLRADGGLDPARLDVLLDGIGRLHAAGLAVLVDAHPETWRPEERPADGRALLDFWRGMAPRLARSDPARTFVEVMNEPVFRDHAAWAALQEEALRAIRAALPRHTAVLTGADWGSIDGLLRLRPLDDPRVVYSVHDYTPASFTHLAFWERGHDREALARLPFPVADADACRAQAARTAHARTREIGERYCGERWDAARVRRQLALAADWGRRHAAPVLLLEFGADALVNAPSRLAYLRAVREAAEREGMGWALWGYADIMGFPARPGPVPAEIDPAVLRALGLPPGG